MKPHRGPDNLDMLMILPNIMVPRNEVKMVFKEAEEKAEAAARTAWRKLILG